MIRNVYSRSFGRLYSVLRDPGKIQHTVASVPAHITLPNYNKDESISIFQSLFYRMPNLQKKSCEIKKIQNTCQLARKILNEVGSYVKVGLTTEELDVIARELIFQNSAYPSPLLYKGFPKSICTSVNNVVVHGIPDSRKLEDGDLINIDITVYQNGVHGDLSEMFHVGKVDRQGLKLVETTRRCLYEAIKICKHGEMFNKIGETVSTIAMSNGFTVCPYFVGHGIGKDFHEEPQILRHRNNMAGVMLKNMVFTIEPVLCEGSYDINYWDDGWTVVTKDDKRAAQFEETILITDDGAEILTNSFS